MSFLPFFDRASGTLAGNVAQQTILQNKSKNVVLLLEELGLALVTDATVATRFFDIVTHNDKNNNLGRVRTPNQPADYTNWYYFKRQNGTCYEANNINNFPLPVRQLHFGDALKASVFAGQAGDAWSFVIRYYVMKQRVSHV